AIAGAGLEGGLFAASFSIHPGGERLRLVPSLAAFPAGHRAAFSHRRPCPLQGGASLEPRPPLENKIIPPHCIVVPSPALCRRSGPHRPQDSAARRPGAAWALPWPLLWHARSPGSW